MSDEKAQFADRLSEAMRARGWEVRPSILERKFNTRFGGQPITSQSASAWLRGQSLPRPDKLRALATLLAVEPQWLLYGTQSGALREPTLSWPPSPVEPKDRSTIDAVLRLPSPQRRLVRELVEALANAS
jgi:hypothetical protein